MSDLYETDFAAWSTAQAAALRNAGRRRVNEAVDWENVAEEIEGLGKSERSELRNRIATVIEHLLKLEVSPSYDPRDGWRDTVRRSRLKIADILEDSPSLRREVPGMITRQMPRVRALVSDAIADRAEAPLLPLDGIAYDEAQILGDWMPDRGDQQT